MMMMKFSALVLLLPLAVIAAPCARRDGHARALNTRHGLAARAMQQKRVASNSWYHPRSHPAHALFARDASPPAVGSGDWYSGLPTHDAASISNIPKAWKDALDAAVDGGKIPDIPPSNISNGTPVYADGFDPEDTESVCSASYGCRLPDDMWDAPDGVFASSFDDGPLPATSRLLKFLKQNNVTTTHFLIGTNILENVKQFQEILDSDNDIAVHTWTHPYMTSLSNEHIVGELGWTIQLIYKSTGDQLPKFWRPPYGDTDARVSAIAREVFGLTTVVWNQDTKDWSIASGGSTLNKTETSLTQAINGTKSPGLIPLEHEHTDTTISIFEKAFPLIQSKGWKFQSLVQASDADSSTQADDAYEFESFAQAKPKQATFEKNDGRRKLFGSGVSFATPAASGSASSPSRQSRPPSSYADSFTKEKDSTSAGGRKAASLADVLDVEQVLY